jgi:hypothetical protein
MIITEIATKLSVSKELAYGLVRYLEHIGAINTSGVRREPGAKGKAPVEYVLSDNAEVLLKELLNKLS